MRISLRINYVLPISLNQVLFYILLTAIGGRPKPELCFLPGRLRWTILPKERYGNALSGCESKHQTFQLRDGHFITELLPPQFVSCHLHTFIEFQKPFQLSRYKKLFTVYGNLILSVGFPGDFRVLLKHSSQNPKQFRITVWQLK